MLILFDIDGTLLSCGGAGRRAMDRAFRARFGLDDATRSVEFAGNTDPAILAQVFSAVGRAPSPAELDAFYGLYLAALEDELRTSSGFRVLPGATALVAALAASGRHVLGIATGNVERGAMIKLARAALADAFEFGGYGSDAPLRADLVRAGIARGQRIASQRLGRAIDPAEIFVLGDTVHDIRGARAAGARAIAVLAGAGAPEAIAREGPDYSFPSLEDPALWALLGVG